MASTQKWGRLSTPIDPLDNTYLARAISLTGRRDLSLTEARDIVRQHDSNHQPLSFGERASKRIKSWLCASSPDSSSSA